MKDKVEISVKKILLVSVIMVTMTALLVGIGTFAYFSATQVSQPSNFFTGSIGFSVNGADPWTQNFNANLYDIKPGMTGSATINLQNTGQNPAEFWIKIANVTTSSTFGGSNSAKEKEPYNNDIDSVIHYGLYNWSGAPNWAANVDPAAFTISQGNHSVTYNGRPTNITRDNWTFIGTVQPGSNMMVVQNFTMNYTVTNWAQLTNMTFTVDLYAQQSQGTPRPSPPFPELPGHVR